jgi:iron complex outermembrane recepter protein
MRQTAIAISVSVVSLVTLTSTFVSSASAQSTSSSSQPSAQSPAGSRTQETVIVTGTMAPAPLGNMGRSIDVVSREEIAQLPIANTNDILRLFSSVEVRARGPYGVQADFSIRGAGFGQALVMVDGVRLNDAQSGHHNADIPVPLEAIERIEVLRGAGSSLHGADAFGGTINIITRRAAPRASFDLAAGSFDLFEAGAGAGLQQRIGERDAAITHALHGSFTRSSGFMTARDHRVGTVQYQASAGSRGSLLLAHTDKEFGANGFYGPAPSREWTRQSLARYEQRMIHADRWQGAFHAAYRAHGDHFIYNETNPSLSESRHRTNAVNGQAKLHYTASPATQISMGADVGGDWIRSSNLGDHDFARGGIFTEMQQRIGSRVLLHPGLRFDSYSRFGSAWSPSLAASVWASPRVKFRASGGHAFRVPTFTELYYRDPNHQGRGELDPERAWAVDAGVDVTLDHGFSSNVTVFGRWENDVIDWVRPTAAERWVTTNIRDVDTRGLETGVRQRFGSRAEASLQYTWQQADAAALDLLSKYALDFARHSVAASTVVRAGQFTVGPRIEFKHRVDGREYVLVDTRLGYRVGRWEVYADGLNLLDTDYQEIRGVAMPGRSVRFGLRVR